MTGQRFLATCALSALMFLSPSAAGAVTVAAPRDIADRVRDALSDGSLGVDDLVGEAFTEFWNAVGNEIARADVCRRANAALGGTRLASPRGADASFHMDVTVTGIDPERTYAQTLDVSTYRDFNTEVIVVAVVKSDGTYGQKIQCRRSSAGAPEGPLESPVEETNGGAHSFAFQTEYGRIITYLPDDIRSGDTISGTVYIEPLGDSEATRRENAARLSGYGLDVAGADASIADGAFRFTAVQGVFAPLILRDGDRVVSAATITNGPAAAQTAESAIPAVTEAGSPASLTGPFDGNSSNTQVTINDQPMEVLAESPRQIVVMCPPTPGPGVVRVNDGGRAFTGPTNTIAISLSAPRTTLARGERTQVTLQVAGLQGLAAPLTVALWASPSVNLQGGNTQNVSVSPAAANSDGVFERRYQLRVVTPGPFDVTAELAP